MGLSFSYEKEKSSLFGDVYRPYAQVFLFSKVKDRWYETWMIVDTGADYTLLPHYFLRALGINAKTDCRLFKTSGIGGEERVYYFPNLKVKLGEWERDIPVGFLERSNIPPLLGRHQFLETFETRFSRQRVVTFSV